MASAYGIWGLRRVWRATENILFSMVHGRRFGPGVRIRGWPIIRVYPGSTLTVGARATLISHSFFNPAGVNHPCVLMTLSSQARIVVGDDVGMSGCAISAVREVVIEKGVLLGANVVITDSDMHQLGNPDRRTPAAYEDGRPVVIETNAFVGMNCMILKGVRVGHDAVVGAGSVVTTDVPPRSVVGGNPASVLQSPGVPPGS